MNGLVIVGFRDDHASSTLFQHNHTVTVVINPQDITDFHIIKGELAIGECSCRQMIKGRIAKDEGKGRTAYALIGSVDPSPFPDIGITKGSFAAIRCKVGPLHSFGVFVF